MKSSIFCRVAAAGTLATVLISNGAAIASSLRVESRKAYSSDVPAELLNLSASDQAVSDTETAWIQPIVDIAAREPAAFAASLDTLSPYMTAEADGSIILNAPFDVIKTVDQEVYATLKGSIEQANQSLQVEGAQTRRRIPIHLLRQIYDLVKRQGRWVWYRVNQCSAAVLLAWPRIQASSPDPADWVIRGAEVCARAMRK